MHEPAHLSRRAVAAVIPLALAAPVTAALPVSSATDPVFTQIELHKLLRILANTHSGDDDAPGYQRAVADEEAAIQALGDMKPATLLGAAAQLAYMAGDDRLAEIVNLVGEGGDDVGIGCHARNQSGAGGFLPSGERECKRCRPTYCAG